MSDPAEPTPPPPTEPAAPVQQPRMTIAEVRDQANRILDEVNKLVVGKRHLLQNILIGLLSGGHILLEGV
ncbi:MAG: hypothetical protein ACFFCO_00640 [Promethearchaeota archaeon]